MQVLTEGSRQLIALEDARTSAFCPLSTAYYGSTPTRTRTRNASFEARNDVLFTIRVWEEVASRQLPVASREEEVSFLHWQLTIGY